jgi:hypothetical protein
VDGTVEGQSALSLADAAALYTQTWFPFGREANLFAGRRLNIKITLV